MTLTSVNSNETLAADTVVNVPPMTPSEIIAELDKYIIGQTEAKRAVAIAVRNRWRRMQISEPMRSEITPKNILMIGPTGVGKTEIARRLAKLVQAPFLKIEATKFTEVGYVGRDVDTIVRDLMEIAVKETREKEIKKIHAKALLLAEEKILDTLIPRVSQEETHGNSLQETLQEDSAARQLYRKKLKNNELDDIEIDIETPLTLGVEIMAPPGMEEMTQQLQSMFQNLTQDRKRKKRRVKIKDALKLLTDEEANKILDKDNIECIARESVEQNGIVFIDEIDKITRRGEHGSGGSDVSREGVQRDLLPLIEGSTVSTRYGMVKTDHVLFIASGSFQLAKPSDLIPELQGRLPIRVELSALQVSDFIRILTEPDSALTKQYQALLKTEGVEIAFAKEGIERLSEIAYHVNETTENIGARRLHTVMEKLLETLSFSAGNEKPKNNATKTNKKDKKVTINKQYVNKQLEKIAKDEDLSRYVL